MGKAFSSITKSAATASGQREWLTQAGQRLRRLKLQQFEMLLVVQRLGSLTAAAEALHTTQPAISQWLGVVEQALGVPLFERGRVLRPTPYTGLVLRHARQIVAQAERLGQEVAALRQGEAGRLRIGTMPVAVPRLLPLALRELAAARPGLQLEVVEDIAAGLWARFARHELDLIVGRLDRHAHAQGQHSEALFDAPHRVVCAPDHPLVQRASPGWADLAEQRWILPPAGTPLRQAIEASFAASGLAPPPAALEATATLLLQAVLRDGEALAVMSGEAAADLVAAGSLAVLPLRLVDELGPVGMCWAEAEPSPALAAVQSALRQAAACLRAGTLKAARRAGNTSGTGSADRSAGTARRLRNEPC